MNETTSDWLGQLQLALGSQVPDLADGDAGRVDFRFGRVTTRSGGSIEFPSSGVTAIVGANNVGKSTLLRDLVSLIAAEPGAAVGTGVIVQEVECRVDGSVADLCAWLGANSRFVSSPTPVFVRGNAQVHAGNLTTQWRNPSFPNRIGSALTNMFVHYGDYSARLGVVQGSELRHSIADAPQHAVHYLQDDAEMLRQLDAVCLDVFGQHLQLDDYARHVMLRLGDLDDDVSLRESRSAAFRERVAALPAVHEQGDGLKSLIGLLLPVITGICPVVVVDEPEAFLHPPQAADLGRHLGRLASEGNRQVILATHDRNLLAGLLASGVDVSIVRMDRRGTHTAISQLPVGALREFWADPTLKYTNALDGLFHRLVVLCEGDQDCHYYAEALHCEQLGLPTSFPTSEVLFTPTGGKDGMPKVARALRAVDVPVVAFPDCDVLRSRETTRALVEALGGSWADYEGDYGRAVAQLNAPRPEVTVEDVGLVIQAVLSEHAGEQFTAKIRERVNHQMRLRESPWEEVKLVGFRAFKAESHTAVKRLDSELLSLGVVLVDEGELETLARDVERQKGAAWLGEALRLGAPCNEASQRHMRRLVSSGPVVAMTSDPDAMTAEAPLPPID